MYMTTIPVPALITDSLREEVLKNLKKVKAKRVGIAILPTSDEKDFENLKNQISFYKEHGFETLVWIAASIGHSCNPAPKNPKYKPLRYINRGDIDASCPMDKKFISDYSDFVKSVAKCGAKMIMLDDDFRLGVRDDGLGCSCDLHMSALNELLGETITEEEVPKKAFSGYGNKYRDAWFEVQKNSMLDFIKAIRTAVDEIDPTIRMGQCTCLSSWDSDGTDVVEMARAFAGNTKPFVRLTGAPYWFGDSWWNWCNQQMSIGDLVEFERLEASWCKEIDIEVFAEGDTHPQPRFETAAAALECFDLLLRTDSNMDGNLKSMFSYEGSKYDYETGYIEAMSENMKLYEKLHQMFDDKNAVGVHPYTPMHTLKDMYLDYTENNFFRKIHWNAVYQPSIRFAVRNSMPISHTEGGVNIVFGKNAHTFPEELLKYGTILDAPAAKILSERGIDVGIDEFKSSSQFDSAKGIGAVSLFEYFHEDGSFVRISPFVNMWDLKRKSSAIPITEYRLGNFQLGHDYTAIEGAFHYENNDGNRFLIYPFNSEETDLNRKGWVENYCRRRQLESSILYLSGKKPKIQFLDNYPMLHVIVKENESAVSVALCNLCLDKIKNAKIKINESFSDITFLNCSGTVKDNVLTLDGTFYPYEFCAFEIKKQ